MVARPKSLVLGPNSSSAASPFTGSQHLLKALRKRVKVSLGILRNSRADLSIRLSWCRACQSRPVRVTHRLESRMREIRTSGSEGGVGSIPHSYLYIRLSLSQTHQSRHKRVTHRLESRMREIRQSGSEGGVADNGHPYPYPYTSPG